MNLAPGSRVLEHGSIREVLEDTCKQKWHEDTTAPSEELREVLQGTDEQFRERLRSAQKKCQDLKPILQAVEVLLTAAQKDSITAAEKKARDYRLNPVDRVLERKVYKPDIWVPVMPTTIIPQDMFAKGVDNITWRRFAFDRAHSTFLEPHRPAQSRQRSS